MSAAAFAIDGCTPQRIECPESVAELARCAASAHAANLAVIPVGNGTQLHIGRRPSRYDLALSTQRLTRILAHEAADMTVTVEAGVTLADLNAALAPAKQRLPLDPPHPERTTIGALIASDACGPLRLSHGKVRDLLIGITVVLADGTLAHGGGRVVKNVAGYDLMKLFTGSFGTLGMIVEATFKLRPLPQHEAVFVLPASGVEAAIDSGLEILGAAVAPHYVEAVNAAGAGCVGLAGPAVVVGCGDTTEEIAAQRERLAERGGERVDVCSAGEAVRLYAAVRDFPADAFPAGTNDRGCGCKVSVLPSQLASLLASIETEATHRRIAAAALSHVGNGAAVIRFIDVADIAALPSFAHWLRRTVRAAGGWTLFDRLPAALVQDIEPWDADPPGLALMRGIKRTLDPKGCLSPERFVGGI
jgi:glycolate oxidase FAD binding subunit